MYRTDYSRNHAPPRKPPEKPPERPANFAANFVVEFLEREKKYDGHKAEHRAALTAVMKKCSGNKPPDGYFVSDYGFSRGGPVIGKLFFTEWTWAMNAVVELWKSRFLGEHGYMPNLIANVVVHSDADELKFCLEPVFISKIEELLRCETVLRLEARIEEINREVSVIYFSKRRDGLLFERDEINTRIEEFKCGMECIRDHILGFENEVYDSIPVLKFSNNEVNWVRVYGLMYRECRRLEDNLPIYRFRREILKLISYHQIMVLVGETGSGKSTQLVQFLADSGLASDGSIICTQPRKIAAISLEHRMQEESHVCYEDDYISCLPYYSSAFRFRKNLIYMTDHCLLQHCMNDNDLKGVSCILVDEAHERSLNTDLLLAMLKRLLPNRPDLRLIIMSATADTMQLSRYFFDCKMFSVRGRKFPVELKHIPCIQGASHSGMTFAHSVAPYVSSVVNAAIRIHNTEQEGTILAFLTSPMEVEWACERFQQQEPNAMTLPLHGKLASGDQSRVFQNFPGKRKVIFSTNVAETSLTIPGVKFVVDSGMAKESRFDPRSGMNVLRVGWVSKSSANQRAGRAGRTEPGCCYRLFSQNDYDSMPAQQEPEIRRVHLGVAVLKIVAMGAKNVREFDFIDAPASDAIEMAVRNLVQLGAVTLTNGELELTDDGWYLVKLGTEPRLGKLILSCFNERLGREGVVLAAVMANSSSIFCRVGSQSDKLKSDCLKVPFCHADGDLFTLLSVYKAWESEHPERRGRWCWENSINNKAMRRCRDTISELENCLKSELQIVVPSYWKWTPSSEERLEMVQHKNLQRAILSSLSENVAMFSGCDGIGYKVALTGQEVQLHPSCSLLMFNNKPDWVVFSEILGTSSQYLVCVTTFDRELLSTLSPPPLFDPCGTEMQKLQLTKLTGLGKTILKKFCGRLNSGLSRLASRMRGVFKDDRIRIEVDTIKDSIQLFSSACDAEKVLKYVEGALDCEKRWLLNECMERCLYPSSPGVLPPAALFGAGAQIKHLELDKRCLAVDVFHPKVSAVDDKELLVFIESHVSGICSVHKSGFHSTENEEPEKWGRITFLTPDAAVKAAELNDVEFDGCKLRVDLSRAAFGMNRAFSFPVVRAKLSWPRRISKGFGILKCDIHDVEFLIGDLSNLLIGNRYIRCEARKKTPDSIVISGIDRLASESEILLALRSATNCTIQDFFLVRGDAVDNITKEVCEEILFKELASVMPKGSAQMNVRRVRVYEPNPNHAFMRAMVTFDGRLHLEAARALEQIEGRTLPGFEPWQKIQCQRSFHTSLSCPFSVYAVIKRDIECLVTKSNRLKGVKCTINRNANGSVWIMISATATKTVSELRRPLEELMNGKNISQTRLTPDILQLLFNRDGIALMKSFEREMEVSLHFDRQRLNVRIFGPTEKLLVAEERFIQSLLNLHEDRQQEVHLRGVGLPYDLMKQVVKMFGYDLLGLKDKVPNAEFTLNTRRHVISISGNKDAKQKVEEIVNEIAQSSGVSESGEENCPICLCEVEDEFRLGSCNHVACRSCLVEQCEFAIRNTDAFPICCFHEGCKLPIWLVDLKLLLSSDKLDELFTASLVAFVTSSCGAYRFCPSPDCPAVYKVTGPDKPAEPFLCGACYGGTCTKCHLENHPDISCEKYKEFKEDPDASLKEWSIGKDEFVKKCPRCGYTIEKAEGCNHVECKCGRHLCWVCLEHFLSSEDCYTHLRSIHQSIT